MRIPTVLAAIVLLGSTAFAAGTEDTLAEAKQHYESGLAHFNLQEYKQAVEEFEAAYRLKPDPVFLYNLAQAERLDNNDERALYFYRAYLRSQPDAPNRDEVEGRIATLEKLLSDKKKVATPPDHTLPPAEKQAAALTKTAPVAATAASQEAPVAHTPIYKKWWLWTIVGVVAAGAAVGIAVGVTQSSPTFDAGLGTVGPAALRVRY